MVNLSHFLGKHVVCKLKDGSTLIGLVQKTKKEWARSEMYYWEVDGFVYSLWGEGYHKEDIVSIQLYEITTKPTFDDPVDPKVEEAKKLLGQMTEEQVAKLLKSLNK